MVISVKETTWTHAGYLRNTPPPNLRIAVVNWCKKNHHVPPFQIVDQLRQKQDTQRASI